ncbi:MAG: site-specific integrase [Methanothrix sp.]|nr:site-specific integrase [Methanothrix sp.]
MLAEKARLQITKYIARAAEKRHRISPHLLRHSFGVWGLDSSVPIHDLKERLGHSTLIVATIYVQATPHHIRDSYLRSGFESKLVPRKAPRRTDNVY